MANYFTYGLKIAGTETFRLASSKLLGKWGSNAQNIRRENRNCFISSPNYIFFQRDQAGAEAKIVAYECRRGNFQLMFELGIKPHTYLAMHLFSEKFECERLCKLDLSTLAKDEEWKIKSHTISKSTKEYMLGKITRHASNYGAGPNTLRDTALEQSNGTLVISATEAKLFLQKSFENTPEILEWHQEIEKQIKDTKELRNLFGYPRHFYQRYTDSLLRNGLAWIPQSTVGCITNIAYTEMQRYIETHNLKWDLLANTHDSILGQCPEGEQEHALEILKQYLEKELISSRGYIYKMGSEACIGYNWGKYDEKINPRGLKEV